MRTYTVKDIDGNVLYTGRSTSQKAFVQSLVTSGKSLAHANLPKFNLAHLELAGGDFEGVCLDGADLRGTVISKANFRGASLRGVRAAGLMAARADFTGADLSRDPATERSSTLEGATLTYACMDGAVLDYANMSGVDMSSSSMVGAQGRKTRFVNSVMHNVDWAEARMVSCDYRGAIMRPTWKVALQHLPDRTRDATMVENVMAGAELGVDNRGFKRDAKIGTLARTVSWSAITAGAVVAGSHIPFDESAILDNPLGKGVGFIVLTTAAVLLKEKLEDVLKDSVTEWVAGANVAVRLCISKAVKGGKALGELAAAFVTSRQAELIVRAMHRPEDGLLARIKATASGKIEVLVCDRSSLAAALARITDAIGGRFSKEADVIVTRTADRPDSFPRAIALRRDGTIEAYWDLSGGKAEAKWDTKGVLVSDLPVGPLWQGASFDRTKVLATFMESIFLDLDVLGMSFDPETHAVRAGRDGSVVVVRRTDNRPHNAYGPEILTPDDEMIFLNRVGRDRRTPNSGTPMPAP